MEHKTFECYVTLSDKSTLPFRYENGVITFYFGKRSITFAEGATFIIGESREGKIGCCIYFHYSAPYKNPIPVRISESDSHTDVSVSSGTISHEVNFFIENYKLDTDYTGMTLSFPELDYFLPSGSHAVSDAEEDDFDTLIFSSNFEEVKPFEVEFEGRNVSFSLMISSVRYTGYPISKAETKTEIYLSFEKTKDVEFLVHLYHRVHDFFSFLCNRKNISLNGAILHGEIIRKRPTPESLDILGASATTALPALEYTDKVLPITQSLVVLDKYGDVGESKEVIQKTIGYVLVRNNFEQLFALFLSDDVKKQVSAQSIHSSVKSRNLIDLKQSLHITSAFEFYYREFVREGKPEVQSDASAEFTQEISAMLDSYIETATGKKKEKANSLKKQISRSIELSLSEKIKKIYNGFSEDAVSWAKLSDVLDEWFAGKVDSLAKAANEWRNELAHEKREFEPKLDIISAIRLVEHLNYCVVLRKANYSDEDIRTIIEKILVR